MRHEAIRNLYANAITIIDDKGVFDNDGNPVEIDENLVSQEVDRLAKIVESKQYELKRRREYPDVKDQLDMIWHGMHTGKFPKLDSFYEAIKSVKDKYPKG